MHWFINRNVLYGKNTYKTTKTFINRYTYKTII